MTPYYSEDGITIYHGDCREVLPALSGVALVLTDPPYGVGFRYETYEDTESSFESSVLPTVSVLVATTPSAICMSMRRMQSLPPFRWAACWYKPGSMTRSAMGGFSDWEPVFIYGPGWDATTDVFVLPKQSGIDRAADEHPCPKPVRLFKWLAAQHESEGVILDPFMGSGSSLVAAKNMVRRAIGIEIEERYCEIAAKRLSQRVLPLEMGA